MKKIKSIKKPKQYKYLVTLKRKSGKGNTLNFYAKSKISANHVKKYGMLEGAIVKCKKLKKKK